MIARRISVATDARCVQMCKICGNKEEVNNAN